MTLNCFLVKAIGSVLTKQKQAKIQNRVSKVSRWEKTSFQHWGSLSWRKSSVLPWPSSHIWSSQVAFSKIHMCGFPEVTFPLSLQICHENSSVVRDSPLKQRLYYPQVTFFS